MNMIKNAVQLSHRLYKIDNIVIGDLRLPGCDPLQLLEKLVTTYDQDYKILIICNRTSIINFVNVKHKNICVKRRR
jgi:DNA-binding NtrC family response regulator